MRGVRDPGSAVILQDRIVVQAETARVWEVLGDLSLMPLWNPKCHGIDADAAPSGAGSRYEAVFRMNGRESRAVCEILDYTPLRILRIRYSGGPLKNGACVDETFVLTAESGRTRITDSVDFSRAGLPWPVRAIMRFLHAFGASAGPSSLDNLRTLVEDAEIRPQTSKATPRS